MFPADPPSSRLEGRLQTSGIILLFAASTLFFWLISVAHPDPRSLCTSRCLAVPLPHAAAARLHAWLRTGSRAKGVGQQAADISNAIILGDLNKH
mmetsp:Transcript_76373/g.184815  ORF Transcript_76373/g.184815 Transcript_76373/m.184815 type:complete len:95 (+) Transcript_76373:4432-4716(+)